MISGSAARDDPRRLRLLIVESEESQRKGMALALTKYSLEIVTTSDPLAAIRLVQEERFDVILSDINFQIMDGLQVISRFRQLAPEVVLVILTACAEQDIKKKLTQMGITQFLEKPVNLDELKRMIGELHEMA